MSLSLTPPTLGLRFLDLVLSRDEKEFKPPSLEFAARPFYNLITVFKAPFLNFKPNCYCFYKMSD